MHAETVDGSNPLAVADAVTRKRAILLSGQGPALLDVECYRSGGHSTTDASVYRTKEELAAWEAFDPITTYAQRLVGAGVLTAEAVETMRADVTTSIAAITAAAVNPRRLRRSMFRAIPP